MAIPVIVYGAASMGITALFRIAAHPATTKVMQAAQNSIAGLGSTLSSTFKHVSTALDWITGNDAPDADPAMISVSAENDAPSYTPPGPGQPSVPVY